MKVKEYLINELNDLKCELGDLRRENARFARREVEYKERIDQLCKTRADIRSIISRNLVGISTEDKRATGLLISAYNEDKEDFEKLLNLLDLDNAEGGAKDCPE